MGGGGVRAGKGEKKRARDVLEHVKFGMPRRHQRGDAEQVVGHFNLGLRRGPAQRGDNNDKYVYGPCSVPGIALDTLHT